MKVREREYAVTSYDRTLEIEREGDVYFVTVHWDNEYGYECTWFNKDNRFQPTPEWAMELEENNDDGDSLGWILETMMDMRSSV